MRVVLWGFEACYEYYYAWDYLAERDWQVGARILFFEMVHG